MDNDGFDLNALIEQAVMESNAADPRDLAVIVLQRIPEECAQAVLAAVLPRYVQDRLAKRRSVNRILGWSPQERHGAASGGHPAFARSKANPAIGRSRKVAGIREQWKAALRDSVHAAKDSWLMLGDCDYEALIFAATERQENAERNLAKAQRYRDLAGRLEKHGVATVKQLPDSVLRGFFDDPTGAVA